MKNIFRLILLLLLGVVSATASAEPAASNEPDRGDLTEAAEKEEGISVKDIIFDHLGDGYGWEVPFNHHKRFALPIIVWASDGLHVFSSRRLEHGHEYKDGDITFRIAGKDSKYKNKVVEIKPDGTEVRPWDISITKNVCAIFIGMFLITWAVLDVARWHRTQGTKAPRKLRGVVEALIEFVYNGVIQPTLKDKSKKFGPYLLTAFFFIFVMNLMGLMVVFPGGANVTGNIAVTLVLAILTFLITNIFATKHYWKEIFNPDVPWWLKYPIPIMPIIELFGIFTKPAALTVRLFANMMGGHMIVIVLTILIFIFAYMGPVVTGATTVVSVIFSIFMLCIDVLVSFIQAYVFTMLSTVFISLAQEDGHHEEAHAKDATPVAAAAAAEK